MPCSIIHVDIDEFFAAVEKQDHPELRGRPILVGGDPRARGVVATASYEARPFGCRSAMPMAQALRLCPHAIVVRPNFERYEHFSRQIFEIFGRFTPLVEGLSIDEAFLDVAGCEKLFGPGPVIAAALKRQIHQATGLTASVGVAPNKFLAKLASDLRKPDGLVVVEPAEITRLLDPLPVRKIWGIGPAAEKTLATMNITTIGELSRTPLAMLVRRFGQTGAEHYHRLSRGLDTREVVIGGQTRSISQEVTFAQDVGDPDRLRQVLLGQVEEISRKLRQQRLLARTVSVKIRYGDFTTLSRSETLPEATDVTATLWTSANELLEAWAERSFQPLRLLGAHLSGLCHPEGRQLSLFADTNTERNQRLDKALDDLTERFGGKAVRRGEIS
jgi:DNA polymerase-4